MLEKLDKLSSFTLRFVVDGLITGAALWLAFLARYDGKVPRFEHRQLLLWTGPVIVGCLLIKVLFGIHKHKWRYVGVVEVVQILESYATFSFILLCLRLLLPSSAAFDLFRLPIGVIAMHFMMSLLGSVGVRYLRRLIHQRANNLASGGVARRILLVGAGIHGITVANEMVLSRGVRVVGFVDDDPGKIGAVIAGVPVLGPVSSLSKIIDDQDVDEVLVCVPPTSQQQLDLHLPKDGSVRTRIIPTLNEILSAENNWFGFSGTASDPKPLAARPVVPIDSHRPSPIRGKTILITGGAGFIGCSLAERLVDNNQLILLDLEFHRKPAEFTRLMGHPNVRLVRGNLLDGLLSDQQGDGRQQKFDLRSLCHEADMVVHAAALVGVNRVCNAGRETLETNYVGTSRLLQAIEGSKKLQRLIYFSTSEVFGVNSFRVDESSPPSVGPIAEARWSYSIAKLAGEHLVKAYFRETQMPIAIVRPFNIFGPRRTGEHALLRFILNALTGKPLQVHGDGSQIRSWCYIDDFCSALLLMLERTEAVGEDFNIGNPSNTLTIYELARKVVDLCETHSPIEFVEHPFPDISIRVPSLAKAHSLLGYKPHYHLDVALTLTIEWYRKHLSFFEKNRPLPVVASQSEGFPVVASRL